MEQVEAAVGEDDAGAARHARARARRAASRASGAIFGIAMRRDHSVRAPARSQAAASLDRPRDAGYTRRTMPNHRRRRWREAMTVRVDLNGLLAAAIGVDGVAPAELEALAARARSRAPRARRAAHRRRPRRSPSCRTGAPTCSAITRRRPRPRASASTPSSCSASVARRSARRRSTQALGDRRGPRRRGRPTRSTRPRSARCSARSTSQRTLFNVVSKSGDTAETMARFLIVRDRLMREFGAVDYKRPRPRHHRGGARLAAPDRERRGLPVARRAAGRRRALLGAHRGRPLPGGGRRASTSTSCSPAPP